MSYIIKVINNSTTKITFNKIYPLKVITATVILSNIIFYVTKYHTNIITYKINLQFDQFHIKQNLIFNTYLVITPAAKPYGDALALEMTSSSQSNGKIETTGPNISSLTTVISSVQFVMTHGEIKQPFKSVCVGMTRLPPHAIVAPYKIPYFIFLFYNTSKAILYSKVVLQTHSIERKSAKRTCYMILKDLKIWSFVTNIICNILRGIKI